MLSSQSTSLYQCLSKIFDIILQFNQSENHLFKVLSRLGTSKIDRKRKTSWKNFYIDENIREVENEVNQVKEKADLFHQYYCEFKSLLTSQQIVDLKIIQFGCEQNIV